MRVRFSIIKLAFGVVTLVVLLVFLLIGTFKPFSLDVSVTTKSIYEGSEVQPKDLVVESRTLFGLGHEITEYALDNQSGGKYLVVSSGGLSRKVVLNKIPVSYLQGECIGRFYQYDAAILTADDLYVRVVYADNSVDELAFDDYEIRNVPDVFTEDVTLKVVYGDDYVNVKVRPVKVTSLDAVYEDGLHIGDTFDVSRVTMRVRFEDGHTIYVKELSSDFEGIVDAGSDIVVRSEKYGDVRLSVDKSNIMGYDVECKDTIYEGDLVTADRFELAAKFSDGGSVPVTDFALDEFHVFDESKVEIDAPGFGVLKCTIRPVAVKDILADASIGSDNVLIINGISMEYVDGFKKRVDMGDVEFVTDLSKPIGVGETVVRFKWFGHEYSFVETRLE